jgi:site-specific DNA-adenine methylase
MYKDNENGFIYIDPPYLDSYNASYNSYSNKQIDDENNVIDNTNIYIDLLEYLKNCKCKILFSINENAITKYIYKDYIKKVYNRQYESTQINKNKEKSKNKQDVLIICNFDIQN